MWILNVYVYKAHFIVTHNLPFYNETMNKILIEILSSVTFKWTYNDYLTLSR